MRRKWKWREEIKLAQWIKRNKPKMDDAAFADEKTDERAMKNGPARPRCHLQPIAPIIPSLCRYAQRQEQGNQRFFRRKLPVKSSGSTGCCEPTLWIKHYKNIHSQDKSFVICSSAKVHKCSLKKPGVKIISASITDMNGSKNKSLHL